MLPPSGPTLGNRVSIREYVHQDDDEEVLSEVHALAATGDSDSVPPRAPLCPHSHAALLVLLFLALCGLSVGAFMTIRHADRSSAESEARVSSAVVLNRVVDELSDLRAAIDTSKVSIGLALSQEATIAPGGRVWFPDAAGFARAQLRVTHVARSLVAEHPYVFAAGAATHLDAQHVPQVQAWIEALAGVPAGTLNLTTSTGDGIRRPPPLAPDYWPITFQLDLVKNARAAAMLDHFSVPARAPLVNFTIQTGRIGATLPIALAGFDLDSVARQTLYQSITMCNMTGVPVHVCVPEPHDPSHVTGFMMVVFDHTQFLRHSLPTEPLTEITGIQIISANGQVTGSWNWPSPDQDLLLDERFTVDEFQDRQWTVRIVVVDEGVSSAVDVASFVVLIGGLMFTVLLAAATARVGHATARRVHLEQRHAAHVREAAMERNALIRFLHATSHDMRTPLHTMSLGLQELRGEQDAEGRGASTPPALVSIGHAVSLLDLIVCNVLDASMADRGEMRLAMEPMDPLTELTRVMETVAPLVNSERVKLTLRPQPTATSTALATMQTPSPHFSVVCDKPRVVRSMLNLLSNAIKFTAHGEIDVSLGLFQRAEVEAGAADVPLPCVEHAVKTWRHPHYLEQADDMVLFLRVRDTGRGMTEAEVHHCTNPFTRTAIENAHGTGLGLHLTLAYVLAHRGLLSVASCVGKGTIITLHFCVKQAAPSHPTSETTTAAGSAQSATTTTTASAATAAAVTTTGTAAGAAVAHVSPTWAFPRSTDCVRRQASAATFPTTANSTDEAERVGSVLVVDDQTTNARLLQRLVQRILGPAIPVVIAFDGEQAVLAVTQAASRVALVLMDLNMPNMDGMEATRRIRAAALPWAQPRITVVTGSTSVEDRHASHVAGADAYILKPCTREVVARELEITFPGSIAHAAAAAFSVEGSVCTQSESSRPPLFPAFQGVDEPTSPSLHRVNGIEPPRGSQLLSFDPLSALQPTRVPGSISPLQTLASDASDAPDAPVAAFPRLRGPPSMTPSDRLEQRPQAEAGAAAAES